MNFNELNVRNIVNHKRYPFMLAASLLVLTVCFLLGIYFSSGNEKYFWPVFGAELLLFMLINAFSFLLINNPGRYIRRIILFYIINLFIIVPLLFTLLGDKLQDYKNLFPAFEALVFCFFASLILIYLLRSIVNFFKED